MASKYGGMGVSHEDLVSEGNRGLIIAANKFNYKVGVRFGTYAFWYIREAVLSAIKNRRLW